MKKYRLKDGLTKAKSIEFLTYDHPNSFGFYFLLPSLFSRLPVPVGVKEGLILVVKWHVRGHKTLGDGGPDQMFTVRFKT